MSSEICRHNPFASGDTLFRVLIGLVAQATARCFLRGHHRRGSHPRRYRRRYREEELAWRDVGNAWCVAARLVSNTTYREVAQRMVCPAAGVCPLVHAAVLFDPRLYTVVGGWAQYAELTRTTAALLTVVPPAASRRDYSCLRECCCVMAKLINHQGDCDY